MIDRAPVKPLDPIARQAAAARSEGQGRLDASRRDRANDALLYAGSASGRRSLALDRSEHGGRLTALRDGGSHAIRFIAIALSACLVTAVAASPVNAESASQLSLQRAGDAGAQSDPWSRHIAEAAKRFAIPERWIRAVMLVESTNDPRAVSPKGAMGLMQIMPTTWEELRRKHRLGDNPFLPCDNILAGAAYLREMLDRFGRKGFLAAYNAGPSRYEDHLATGRPLPHETVNYVAKLMPMIDGGAPILPGPRRSDASNDAGRSPLFVSSGRGGNVDPVRADCDTGAMSDTVFTGVDSAGEVLADSNTVTDLTAIAPPSDHRRVSPATTVQSCRNGLFVRRSSGSPQ